MEALELDGSEDEDCSITEWVICTQPAVRSVELVGFQIADFRTLLSISPRTVSPSLAEGQRKTAWLQLLLRPSGKCPV